MHCPKCNASHVVEYYPAFTNEMREELVLQGYSDIEIKHFIEQWEDEQQATGGFCPECQHEWLIQTGWEEDYDLAYG